MEGELTFHPSIELVLGLDFFCLVLISLILFPWNYSSQNHQTKMTIHLSFPELLHIYICCLGTNINNTLLLSSSRMAPNYPGLQLFTLSPRMSRDGMCNHFSKLLAECWCHRQQLATRRATWEAELVVPVRPPLQVTVALANIWLPSHEMSWTRMVLQSHSQFLVSDKLYEIKNVCCYVKLLSLGVISYTTTGINTHLFHSQKFGK